MCAMPMPAQDGIETIQQIRELYPSVPIIAIPRASGADKFSLLNNAMTLGANRTVSKPFTVDQLLAAIDGLLDRVRA